MGHCKTPVIVDPYQNGRIHVLKARIIGHARIELESWDDFFQKNPIGKCLRRELLVSGRVFFRVCVSLVLVKDQPLSRHLSEIPGLSGLFRVVQDLVSWEVKPPFCEDFWIWDAFYKKGTSHTIHSFCFCFIQISKSQKKRLSRIKSQQTVANLKVHPIWKKLQML